MQGARRALCCIQGLGGEGKQEGNHKFFLENRNRLSLPCKRKGSRRRWHASYKAIKSKALLWSQGAGGGWEWRGGGTCRQHFSYLIGLKAARPIDLPDGPSKTQRKVICFQEWKEIWFYEYSLPVHWKVGVFSSFLNTSIWNRREITVKGSLLCLFYYK